MTLDGRYGTAKSGTTGAPPAVNSKARIQPPTPQGLRLRPGVHQSAGKLLAHPEVQASGRFAWAMPPSTAIVSPTT